ncbi:MAG: helix-turn-helix domain-containing protein [Planctomycetaceae bacterium]|nr:helix-turn-helix domain-containing protein [Planctomycetaceae bacterium]
MSMRLSAHKVEMSTNLQSIDVHVLQALFNLTADIAFFIKDEAGRYAVVNESLLARHGLKSQQEALGKTPQEICPGKFGSIPTEQDQRVLRSGKALLDHLELQWHRPNEPVWCLTSKIPLKDGQGKTIGLIGFSRDVRTAVRTGEIPKAFAEVLEAFEQTPAMELTPALLAARSKLSTARLARLTKKLFGLTPSQLIVKTRITIASRLLRETQLSVAAIAQQCGYSDQSAFTRSFRQASGVTPLEYRRGAARE